MFTHVNSYFFGSAGKLWFIFVLVGLFVLVSPYFIYTDVPISRIMITGSISVLIGMTLKLNYGGIQIDLENHQQRIFTSVFGLKNGKWIKLPKLKKVVLTSKNVGFWNTPNGISPTFSTNTKIYTIAVFSDSENPELLFQTENQKDAKLKASLLAKELHLDLIEQD